MQKNKRKKENKKNWRQKNQKKKENKKNWRQKNYKKKKNKNKFIDKRKLREKGIVVMNLKQLLYKIQKGIKDRIQI